MFANITGFLKPRLGIQMLSLFGYVAFCLAIAAIISNFLPVQIPLETISAESYPVSLPKPTQVDTKLYPPQSISIPILGINNLEIKLGGIKNGEWILDKSSAFFMQDSGKPGEGYNTVVYAHAQKGLFLDLHKISTGDEITLKNTNGKEYVYKVRHKMLVVAEAIHTIESEVPNTLTLFTCGDLNGIYRVVVKADLVLI